MPTDTAPIRLPHAEGIGPMNATRVTILASYPDADHGDPAAWTSDRQFIAAMLDKAGFSGSAVRHVDGRFQHEPEPGLQAEVIFSLATDPDGWNRIYQVAEDLAVTWDQEEVWITTEEISLAKVVTR